MNPSPHPDPLRWKALALLCAADFMVILDAQIVILALPSIQRDLGFSGGGEQWVMSAYLLTFGGLLLLGGRSADLLGRRRMFMIGTALFLFSSLLCGFAWTGGTLIVARVLQGVSAAIMAPTALSILMTTFDEGTERNKALGVWSAVGGVGATAALLVGGPLTSWLGWEWIFFINVPVALVLFGLSPVLLKESRAAERGRNFDLAGAVTITAALALLVYAVVEAPDIGWSHPRTLLLQCLSALLIAVFVLVESRSRAPLAPLGIFRSRALAGGNLVLLLLGMAAWGMSFTVSEYAQQVLGYSALMFGLSSAVMPVMAAVGSVAGQAVVTRTGPRRVAMAGMALTGIGCLLLAQVSVGGSYFEDLFLGLLVFGPGLGAAFVAASVASLAGVAERDSGLASGLNTASFQIGGAFGVAILSTVGMPGAGAHPPLDVLTEGFRTDFAASIAFSAAALLVALLLPGRIRRARAVEPALSKREGPH